MSSLRSFCETLGLPSWQTSNNSSLRASNLLTRSLRVLMVMVIIKLIIYQNKQYNSFNSTRMQQTPPLALMDRGQTQSHSAVLLNRLSLASEQHFQSQLLLLALPPCLILVPLQSSLLELPLSLSHALETQLLEHSVLDHSPNQHFHRAQAHRPHGLVLEDEGLIFLEDVKKLFLFASFVVNRSQDTLLGLFKLVQHRARPMILMQDKWRNVVHFINKKEQKKQLMGCSKGFLQFDQLQRFNLFLGWRADEKPDREQIIVHEKEVNLQSLEQHEEADSDCSNTHGNGQSNNKYEETDAAHLIVVKVSCDHAGTYQPGQSCRNRHTDRDQRESQHCNNRQGNQHKNSNTFLLPLLKMNELSPIYRVIYGSMQ